MAYKGKKNPNPAQSLNFAQLYGGMVAPFINPASDQPKSKVSEFYLYYSCLPKTLKVIIEFTQISKPYFFCIFGTKTHSDELICQPHKEVD